MIWIYDEIHNLILRIGENSEKEMMTCGTWIQTRWGELHNGAKSYIMKSHSKFLYRHDLTRYFLGLLAQFGKQNISWNRRYITILNATSKLLLPHCELVLWCGHASIHSCGILLLLPQLILQPSYYTMGGVIFWFKLSYYSDV